MTTPNMHDAEALAAHLRQATDRITAPAPAPRTRATDARPAPVENLPVTDGLILRLTEGDPTAVVTVSDDALGGPVAVVVIPVNGCAIQSDSRRIGAWFATCECDWISGPHRSAIARSAARIHSVRCRTAHATLRRRLGGDL